MTTILFIDDDIRRASSHIEMIELSGRVVELANSAHGAVETFSRSKGAYSCVILDMMMPAGQLCTAEETNFGRTTGLVLLKKLRDIDASIPIVVLTVDRSPDTVQKAMSLGATEYLLKPVRPSRLIEVLDRIAGNGEI